MRAEHFRQIRRTAQRHAAELVPRSCAGFAHSRTMLRIQGVTTRKPSWVLIAGIALALSAAAAFLHLPYAAEALLLSLVMLVVAGLADRFVRQSNSATHEPFVSVDAGPALPGHAPLLADSTSHAETSPVGVGVDAGVDAGGGDFGGSGGGDFGGSGGGD